MCLLRSPHALKGRYINLLLLEICLLLWQKKILYLYISKNVRKFLFYFFTYYYITHIATWKHSLIEKIYNLILLLTNHILSMAQYSKHEKNHCNNKSVCTVSIILLGLFIKYKPFTFIGSKPFWEELFFKKNKKKAIDDCNLWGLG